MNAPAGVDFKVVPGTVHGLIGENGAGKSTLMKIIAGAIQADSGQMLVEGQAVRFAGTRDAIARRIVTIYQDSDLIPTLSVAKNVYLNQERPHGALPFIDRRRQVAGTHELLERFGLDIDPMALVSALPTDVQKMVQIVKAVSKDARVLLIDEPTSTLTASEVEFLLPFIRSLAARGVGVVFISHYLSEVLRVCDRITILGEGSVVRSVAKDETDMGETNRAMIGRVPGDRELFSVRGLCVKHRLTDVSLAVREGEVLGITELIGSGTTELAKALFRSEDVSVKNGEYRLAGEVIALSGIAFVPDDRKTEGLFGSFSVADNICMPAIDSYTGAAGLLDSTRMHEASRNYLDALAIEPCVLILDESTIGIDVGTKFEIRRPIRGIADRGVGIILVTSEIEELEKLCDHVLVLFRGRVVRSLAAAEITKESILKSSMGGL